MRKTSNTIKPKWAPDWVKAGAKFKVMNDGFVYHICGYIDGRIILKWWRPSKQRWEYSVEDDIWFTCFGPHIEVVK